jgi:hypothetical protein
VIGSSSSPVNPFNIWPDLFGGIPPARPREVIYPDIPGWRPNAPETSREAAEVPSLRERVKTIQHRIIALLESEPAGLTCDEILERLSLSRPTGQPRISELKVSGRIMANGERRKNKSGCSASVWVIAPLALHEGNHA